MADDASVEVQIKGSTGQLDEAFASAKSIVTSGTDEMVAALNGMKNVMQDVGAQIQAALQGVGVATQEMAVKAGESAGAFTLATEGMKGAFAGVTAAMEGVQAKFLAITAVLAGGHAFGEVISETNSLTAENIKLSKTMGMTLAEASGVHAALNKLGISTDQYTGAAQKLSRQIKMNEEGLNQMGIATKNAAGEHLPLSTVMLSAIETLKGYRTGMDRNMAAMALFGRGAGDVTALLKLNREEMDEGAETAKKLGLVTTQDSVNAMKAYKVATNESKEVFEAFKVTIGSALLPVLTSLAEWFKNNGQEAIASFRTGFNALIGVVRTFAPLVVGLTQFIGENMRIIISAAAAYAAYKLTLNGIPAAMNLYKFATEAAATVSKTFSVLVMELTGQLEGMTLAERMAATGANGIAGASEIAALGVNGLTAALMPLGTLLFPLVAAALALGAAFYFLGGSAKPPQEEIAKLTDEELKLQAVLRDPSATDLATENALKLARSKVKQAQADEELVGKELKAAKAELENAEAMEAATQASFDGASAMGEYSAAADKARAHIQELTNKIKEMNAAIKGQQADISGAEERLKIHQGKTFSGGDDKVAKEKKPKKDKSKESQWEAELNEQKLALAQKNILEDTDYAFSKQKEVDFWQAKLNTLNSKSLEYKAVLAKLVAAEQSVNKERLANEEKPLKDAEGLYKNNIKLKMDAENTLLAFYKQKYGENSHQYIAQADVIKKTAQEMARQVIQSKEQESEVVKQKSLEAVTAEESRLNYLKQLGLVSDGQMLQAKAKFENERFAIEQKSLAARLELKKQDPDASPIELQKLQDQIEQITRQHNQRMVELAQQAALQSKQKWLDGIKSVSNAWAENIGKMITLQQGFAQTIKGMWQGVTDTLRGMFVKIAENWITTQLTALIATQSAEEAAHKRTNLRHAKDSYTGAYKAVVDTPIVGPVLAPIAGAAAFNAVTAFAAQGYDVPANVNPVTQLHQKEMVLPAEHAETIRNMKNGATAQMPPINIMAHDSKDMHRYFTSPQGIAALRGAMDKMRKNW
jgi:hypothetical protein